MIFKDSCLKRAKFAYGHVVKPTRTKEENNEVQEKRFSWMKREYGYFDYADKYSLAYYLKKGEIYEVDWGMNVNAEFSGRHYGVVLQDSLPTNPMVLMCPLKTNHKPKVNPYSDVYIGVIDCLPNLAESVAVANQIRMVDKMRLYTQLAIGPNKTNLRLEEELDENIDVYRLDEDTVNMIIDKAGKVLTGNNKPEVNPYNSGND